MKSPEMRATIDKNRLKIILDRKFYHQNLWLYFDFLSLNFSAQFNLAQLYVCTKGATINCAPYIVVLQYQLAITN
jgi:hypothetical protein